MKFLFFISMLFVFTSSFGVSITYSQCGSCIDNYFSVYDEFKGSEKVFVGKVKSIKKIEKVKNTDSATNTDYYEFEIKFKVLEAWKTNLPKFIIVINIDSDNSHFKIDEKYLVYGYIMMKD